MRRYIRRWKAIFALATVVAPSPRTTLGGESSSSADIDDDPSSAAAAAAHREAEASGSRIVQSLFRFPASRLGPEFDDLLQNWHHDWLRCAATNSTTSSSSSSTEPEARTATTTTTPHHRHRLPPITPEPSGKHHAYNSVSSAAATLFRRQCYGPAPSARTTTPATTMRNLYKNFERRRKDISFEYMEDAKEEMRLLHTMTNRFYPAFLISEDEEGDGDGGGSNKEAEKSRRRDQRGATTRMMHKKKSRSTIGTIHAQSALPYDFDSPSKLSFQMVSSVNGKEEEEEGNDNPPRRQQWSWYPPGHFSSRGTPDNMPFRMNMYEAMRNRLERRMRLLLPDFDGFEHGRQSGMFWYPPGGVREWHDNRLDLVGNTKKGGRSRKEEEIIFASQVWRMYFVRTARDPEFDEKLDMLRDVDVSSDRGGGGGGGSSGDDHSAMHILPGEDPGITLDVLRGAGARPLTKEEEMRRWSDEFAEGYSVPRGYESKSGSIDDDGEDDSNGVGVDTTALDRESVWRIPDRDGYVTLFRIPEIWHCIVSEEVHRYSLGFAFSDREVQALLRLAGVEFDVADGENVDHTKDEL